MTWLKQLLVGVVLVAGGYGAGSIAGGALALVIFGLYWGTELLDMDAGVIERVVPWVLFAGILTAGWCFTLVGGVALRRFDVSRQIS